MLNITQLRELIGKHNKLSKITIPPKATKAQLIKLIEGQGYKVFEDQGKIVGGAKRIIKPTPAKKATPAKKPAPAKKIDPNSTGQKNLQELLRLGDLSSKIESERQKLVNKDWYIVPITYLIGELYKKGLRDFKGTPLEGDGGRFGADLSPDARGWSVVYQLRGDKMINVYRLNLEQLDQQANTSFKKPSELTDKEMLIDDIFSDKDPKATEKYLEERGGVSTGETGRSFDVRGIKHLKDVNLSKDKWALKLGLTESDIYKDLKFNWNLPWAKDGEKLLEKLINDEKKKSVRETKEKISKMTVKQLKEQVPSYNRSGLKKKADYVKYLLDRAGELVVGWDYFIKNGR